MGFFYQLKGLTIAELALPLVLMGVLILLRAQIETVPQESAYHEAKPLLSAGLIPTVQQFCPGGTKDEYDFVSQEESVIDRTFLLIQQLQDFLGDLNPSPGEGDGIIDIIEKLINATGTGVSIPSELQDLLQELVDAIGPIGPLEQNFQQINDLEAELPFANGNNSSARPRGSPYVDPLPEQCRLPDDMNETVTGVPGTVEPDEDLLDKLLQAWDILKPIVCNPIRDSRDGGPKQVLSPGGPGGGGGDLPDGLPGGPPGLDQMETILKQLLRHMVSSNPKILYAPAGTDADDVINNILGAFKYLQDITDAAENWLEFSSDIEDNIEIPDLPLRFTAENDTGSGESGDGPSLPDMDDVKELLENLVTLIDTLACAWLKAVDDNFLLTLANIFVGFNSEEELVNYFKDDAYDDGVIVVASVVFTNVQNDGSLPPRVSYKLRMNATFTATTQLIRPLLWHPRPQPVSTLYHLLGFTWLQDLVDNAIIQYVVGEEIIEPGVYIEEEPHPCYRDDDFQMMIEYMMPLNLMIAWLFPFALLARGIVYEKEFRLKEMMKMMGLRASALWTSWFTVSFIQAFVTASLVSLMLVAGNVLAYSNGFIILLIVVLYGLNAIFFAFFLSVLFSKAKIAAACAGIIFMMSYVPYMYIAILESMGPAQPFGLKCFVSIFGASAFGLIAKHMAYFEVSGVGLQWSNVHHNPMSDDDFTVLIAMLMMITGMAIFAILSWYIANVRPGPYGQPEVLYFPFTKSYWCPESGRSDDDGDDDEAPQCDGVYCMCTKKGLKVGLHREGDRQMLMGHRERQLELDPTHFERDPRSLKQTIVMEGLTKTFGANKTAVDNLSMSLYEDQILSFLGHNGAGKTTTMSMLTGMLPSTSGSAHIYGHNVAYDMRSIRRILGMCPQHNVLFESLTVEEHLRFYAMMKGVSSANMEREIEILLNNLGLIIKRHDPVDTLSGGMKRKLSVGIAFVGGSKAVILDEPTAGVDPCSRRDIWDLLLKYKKGRTIMLSTHHMDEADVLGDRIAMISHGQLLCCGSSLFLKGTFGDGYHLRVVKQTDADQAATAERGRETASVTTVSTYVDDGEASLQDGAAQASSAASSTLALPSSSSASSLPSTSSADSSPTTPYPLSPAASTCSSFSSTHGKHDTAKTSLLIQSYVKGAYLKEASARELHYVLPYKELGEGSFEAVFKGLSKHREALKMKSYGVSDSTLEEVFIKVIGQAKEDSEEDATSTPQDKFNEDVDVPLASITSSPNYTRSLSVWDQPKTETFTLPNGEGRRKSAHYLRQLSSPIKLTERSISWDTGRRRIYNSMTELDDILEENTSDDDSNFELVDSYWLALQQMYASFVKRILLCIRSWKWMAAQLIMPTLFVIIAMIAGSLGAPSTSGDPPLELSTTQFYNISKPKGNNYVAISNQFRYNASNYATPDEIRQTFLLDSGIGAACVINTPWPSDPEDVAYAYGCGMYTGSSGYAPANRGPSAENNTKASSRQYYPECHCADDKRGLQCSSHGYDNPPSLDVVTQDILLDSSKQNETVYLLHTANEYRLSRYGGLSVGNIRSHVPDWGALIPSTLGSKVANRKVTKVWHHSHGYHAMPTYVNALKNAVLRANLPPEKGDPAAYGILAFNHPMEGTTSIHAIASGLVGAELVMAIFIVGGLAFVPAGYAIFLVQERASKAKHLQFVSGLHPAIYWCNNLLCDLLTYLAPALCCIIVFLIFDLPAFTSGSNFTAVSLLIVMFGVGCIPMMYPATFMFSEPSAAYVFLAVYNIFTGVLAMFVTFVLDAFSDEGDLATVSDVLKVVFLIFPTFALGRGIMDISLNHMMNDLSALIGLDHQTSALAWDVSGRNLVALAVVGIISFTITFFLEYRFFMKPKQVQDWQLPSTSSEDADVAAERRRVTRGDADDDVIRLHDLTKMYTTRKRGKHLAVNKLCLGIPKGECFGMLGINGAGKTTTFKMLTGDHGPSMGNAIIAGHSVTDDMTSVRRKIGYCPQFDALFDELNSKEHLMLYARLRGIARKDQKRIVESAIQKLELSEYADRRSDTYSGGNKRKLSTAIALMGNPPVVFLDEPTAGMDPYAKRFLWDLVLGLVREGKCIILTSHSMEECETLCNRLSIMVKGSFQCMGSVQHLKSRFGDGYTIKLTVKGPRCERQVAQVVTYMTEHLPEAVLKETHHKMLHFEIPSEEVCLSRIFARLQRAKAALPVEEYAVCQNTLDNVFINFVKSCAGPGEEVQLDDESVIDRAAWPNTEDLELGLSNEAYTSPGNEIQNDADRVIEKTTPSNTEDVKGDLENVEVDLDNVVSTDSAVLNFRF